MFNRILIAVNDSDPANLALEAGAQLAAQLGATVGVVHVVVPAFVYTPDVAIADDRILTELRREGRDLLRRAAARIPPSVRCEQFMTEGDPADRIVDAADQFGADLIVLGTHGRGRISQFFLGSTAEAVIRRATCPVLVARPRRAHAPADVGHSAPAPAPPNPVR